MLGRGWLIVASVVSLASPSHAGLTVLGSLDRHQMAQPGAVIEGVIEIQNTLDQDAIVRVMVNDYDPSRPSGQRLVAAPAHDRSLAPYIQLMAPTQAIAPGERARVGYALRLPTLIHRPDLAGSYWVVLMVQQHEAVPAQPSTLNEWLIRQRFQTAVRITTHIEAGATSALEFGSWSDEGGLTLTNTGTALADVRLVGELFDALGQSQGRTDLGRIQIYPGGSERIEWLGEQPAVGTYQAVLIAHPQAWMRPPRTMGRRYTWTVQPREQVID